MEKGWFGLLGIVVGFVLNKFYMEWVKRSELKKDRYYLAVVVTMQLDRFFDDTVSYCHDNGVENEQGEYFPENENPKFELPSMDVDWRCLPQRLMRDILWLPERINDATKVIGSVSEHVAFPPYYEEFYETRQYEFAKLGLHSNELASQLRKIAKLPTRTMGDEYFNPLQFLTDKVAEIEKMRNDRIAENQRIREEMNSFATTSN